MCGRAHAQYKGNIEQINKIMPGVICSILMCFKGYCGKQCSQYSLVCAGDYRKAKNYIPSNIRLRMTEDDVLVMKKCIETFLGPKSIESTKFLTSTQKCEAVNRAYQASVPKATTFTRNFTGRVHGTILYESIKYNNICIFYT